MNLPTAPSLKTSKSLVGAGSMTAGAFLHSTVVFSLLAATLMLTGCNEDKTGADGSLSSMSGGRQLSVIGSIRPKADPAMIEKIRMEEENARRQAMAAAQAANNQNPNQAAPNGVSDPAKRDLPSVDTSPISGIAQAFGFGQNQNNANNSQPANNMGMSAPAQVPTPPPIAGYGGYQSGPVGGLIPPPPAVSLTTSASPYVPPTGDPYAQAYAAPPYGYPAPAYSAAPPSPAHPQGSMFSSGATGAASSVPDDSAKKKANMVVITPTGMDARSPYKQRDDLKILVKAAFANAPIKELRDDKVAALLARTDVSLPSESTKGNISLNQRQIDNLFKTQPLDKKVMPSVKKIEADIAQAYYRYLYAFNKFALTQQQVAARKQEVDVADSASEKQRAAADLSSAQNEADQAKDDLHAAQQDLASISGAQAARSVIAKVSGVTPSLDSLAVADNNDSAPASGKKDEGLVGSVANALNVFNVFGHKEKAAADTSDGDQPKAVAQAAPAKDKGKDKKKGKGAAPAAVAQVASAAVPKDAASPPSERAAAPSTGPIAFELKNVQTTPRKSILKVSVRNNSTDSLSLDGDEVAVLEGDKKLAEAAVRAEWDSAQVGPNQEVSGTITIFGRPWNDKLTVSLSEGGKSVQLHR